MSVCEFVKWFLFALVLSFIGRVLSIMLLIGFDLLRACYHSYRSYSITRRFFGHIFGRKTGISIRAHFCHNHDK